jgi:hypothetical protein
MKTGVLTSYTINGNKYGSYVLGKNSLDIVKLINRRGLNETIESSMMEIDNTIPDYARLDDVEFLKRLPEILHSASFLSLVALNSKKLTPFDILGDEGIIHELAHLNISLNNCNKKSLTFVRDLISTLQKNAIGFY